MVGSGFAVWDARPDVAAWAQAARHAATRIDTSQRRHGGTWFVGVDALPNAADGSLDGVPWPHSAMVPHWHKAQLSIIGPGYPRQDPQETEAAHAYRKRRDGAHVDGLLPVGADKRRFLREPHAFILGIPLNDVTSSPLVVWPGSHVIIGAAFRAAFAGIAPADWAAVDVTEPYHVARRQVFETCTRTEVRARPGQVIYLHRHLVHGVALWPAAQAGPDRMIAYFRPLVADVAHWL